MTARTKRKKHIGTHDYLLYEVPIELWARFQARAETGRPGEPPRSLRQVILALMRWYVAGGQLPPPPKVPQKRGPIF